MSIPVISTTTSILGYNQYQSWQYQPYATNTPTSWACSGLPSGMSINTTTGLISGAANVAGVFNAALSAINGDGTSTALILTIGIAAASASSALLTNSGYQVTIDVETKSVTVGGSSTSAIASNLTTTSDPGTSPDLRPAPILYARRNDSLLVWVNFVKNGEPADLTITALKIALKHLEGDGTYIVLGTAFTQVGSGAGAYFGIYADLSAASGLDALLANYQSDDGTSFDALTEINWTETNALYGGGFGPSSFKFSSQDFGIQIATDMAT